MKIDDIVHLRMTVDVRVRSHASVSQTSATDLNAGVKPILSPVEGI